MVAVGMKRRDLRNMTVVEASATMLDNFALDNFQARGNSHSLKKIWTQGIR